MSFTPAYITKFSHTHRSTSVYQMVWKWHFFAALYVLPFMAMLSVTGALYLFDDSIENILYNNRLNVVNQDQRLSYITQEKAVLATGEKLQIRSIFTPSEEGRSVLFEYQDKARTRSYAWVDPYTANVLAVQERDNTFMRIDRKIHGELLLGDIGTKFVELAAHWAIVLFVTGLYLWWPRGNRTWRKVFTLPNRKGRMWWKQTHMFAGVLACVLVVPILVTGLPWTDVWGGMLKSVQSYTGQESPSRAFGGAPILSNKSIKQRLSYERVIEIAQTAGAPEPYEIRPPKNLTGTYYVVSSIDSRTDRVELHIDQFSGAIVNRVDFDDYPPIAAAVSLGIAFHQGELYGLVNKLQNLLAAGLGLTLSITGFVAWWKRRPAGSIGVPQTMLSNSLGKGLAISIIVLAVLLPLMGLSLIVVLLLDWILFRKLGWFQSAFVRVNDG